MTDRECRITIDLDEIEGEISKPIEAVVEDVGSEDAPTRVWRLSMFVSELPELFEVLVYAHGHFGQAAVAAQKAAAALTQYAKDEGRF